MTGCARFEGRVAREMAGLLSSAEREALRAHVRGCASCRAVWDRAAAVEARVLGAGRLDRQWSALEQRLGGATPPPVARARTWVAAAAAASMGAMALVWWAPSVPGPWGVRGEVASPSRASLRLVQVVERGPDVQIVDIGSDPRVPPQARLIPLVTNLESAPRWVSLWVQLADGAPLRRGEARRLAAGSEDHRLDDLWVEPAWSGRPVTIWAVFAPTPDDPPMEGLVSGDRDGVSIRRLVVHVTAGPTGTP